MITFSLNIINRLFSYIARAFFYVCTCIFTSRLDPKHLYRIRPVIMFKRSLIISRNFWIKADEFKKYRQANCRIYAIINIWYVVYLRRLISNFFLKIASCRGSNLFKKKSLSPNILLRMQILIPELLNLCLQLLSHRMTFTNLVVAFYYVSIRNKSNSREVLNSHWNGKLAEFSRLPDAIIPRMLVRANDDHTNSKEPERTPTPRSSRTHVLRSK